MPAQTLLRLVSVRVLSDKLCLKEVPCKVHELQHLREQTCCYLPGKGCGIAQDVETLKKISVYRKLGISIKDIQSLLETGDKSILLLIYQEKVQEKVLKDSELVAFEPIINS